MDNRFYRRIWHETNEERQLGLIIEACDYYTSVVPQAIAETAIPSGRIETAQTRLAGVTTENYSRLQDLENILVHITNIEDRKIIEKMRFYKEHYSSALSDRTAEKYADLDDGVQTIRAIRYLVSDVRNQFLAVSKGLEILHYQITNVTKLRAVGLDDATF